MSRDVLRLLGRIRRLSWRDRYETMFALGLAIVIEVGLRTLRLPHLARLLGIRLQLHGVMPTSNDAPNLPPWARQRVRSTRRVMKRSPYGTCLRRSLVVGQRLRRLDPCLRIGVKREDGRFVAHAWLEIDGASLDLTSAEYTPFEVAQRRVPRRNSSSL